MGANRQYHSWVDALRQAGRRTFLNGDTLRFWLRVFAEIESNVIGWASRD